MSGYSTNKANPTPVDDEADLSDLFAALWQGKWVVFVFSCVFAAAAIVIAISLPNIYRAEALLAPSISESKGGLSGLAGQFGGLASLAGVDLGGGGTDKTALALEVLQSRSFITAFIRKHELDVPLVAAKGWDMESSNWILDKDIYDSKAASWVRDVNLPNSGAPTDWELYGIFKKNMLSVSQDKQTGMITLGIESFSPVAAQQWVSWLVDEVNQRMRQTDISEAERSIQYLRDQLEKTAVADMQKIFYQLIEQQTQTGMLAQVKEEYVFKTVDAAVIPEEKFKPKRALICIVGLLLGCVAGTIVVLVRRPNQLANSVHNDL